MLISNIEYFRISTEIGSDFCCMGNYRFMSKWWKVGNGWGPCLVKLSHCQDLNDIEFHCMVDILGITYKENTDEKDYKMAVNMNKSVGFEWKIDDELTMLRMKKMSE